MTDEQKVTPEFQQAAVDCLEGLKEELAFGQVQKGKDYLGLASVPKLHKDPSVETVLCLRKNCDDLLTVYLKNICIPHTWEPYMETAVIDTYLHDKIWDFEDVTSPEFIGLYHAVQGALRRPRTAIDVLRLIALRNNDGLTRITEISHGKFSVIVDVPCDYMTFPKEKVESTIHSVLARGARFAQADYLLRQYLLPDAHSRDHDFQYLLERIVNVEEELENVHENEASVQEEQEITI